MRSRIFLTGVVLGLNLFSTTVDASSIEVPSNFLEMSCNSGYLEDNKVYYSQADQDKFVYSLLYGILGKQDEGCYLEIGAGEPIFINNSYFFEKNLHWKGVSIDISDNLDTRWYAVRTNPLLTEDATKSDYIKILQDFPRVIDYLSLDVDGYYDTVLKRIPLVDHIFKIITIEHDFYRYGDIYREKERQILQAYGYYLLCSNVMHDGYAFEDWWIHPSAFPSDVFEALKTLDLQEKEYSQLVPAIQTVCQ